ncbi:hypothetical protein [Acinetobacter sp. ANC 3813]|uniref:hypothetical protein n=1 Tax=Acinetobacter sp. ANC 3813 TaxID=1977873 RepID=UPI000A347307|nr:hypothetical protein [Acinetobacter sp. ANC 3813]OTG87883.1 hypothetical protein B9T34_16235 [Acinetobacter sp. ANC 3813]
MAKFVLAELAESHPLVIKIREVLEQATKQKVALIIVDKMIKRGPDQATKKITFSMEEGQTLSFVLRTDGDVVQHFMNNKNIPLVRVMDYDNMTGFMEGLESLALKLKANQDKFNVKRLSARVIIPRTKAPAPTVRKRIEMTRAYLKEQEEILQARRDSLAAKKAELEAIKGAA